MSIPAFLAAFLCLLGLALTIGASIGCGSSRLDWTMFAGALLCLALAVGLGSAQ